jgi:D-psicose/D-tagatose/L-ribulose 3-epimerase
MKFGLNVLLYTDVFTKKHLDLVRKVADLGYDGIEIPFIDLDSMDVPATRQALQSAGIGATACAVMVPGTSLISDDAAERQAGVDRLERIIGMAADVGADTVAGPLYSPVSQLTGRGRTPEEWQRAVEGLATAAELAGKADVVLAIEPLNRFETYFLNTAADALALVGEVSHPNLLVQLDTFHAHIEENDTASAIRALGSSLGHFHASENTRGTPGTGQVAWKACFAALREIGYDQWVTIESFARGIVDLCAAAAIWRDIYDSADGLATKGLAFLRGVAAVA